MISKSLSHFERHNFFTKLLRIVTVPFLNHIPSILLRHMMKATSHDAATVVERGGSTHALEAMYTRYHHRPFARGFISGLSDFFWHHAISQPKALRNRLAIVEQLVTEKLRNNNQEKTYMRILNVAGGSSRAIIQTLAVLKKEKLLPSVQIFTVDYDERAIALGKRIASEFGVGSHFIWIHGKAQEIPILLKDESFDLIEIVGLLDYFSDEKVLGLLLQLHSHLIQDGEIIVANVMPNDEMSFIQKTGWPKMYYRTADEFNRLIRESGFLIRDTIIEPLKIHAVVKAVLN